MSERERRDWLFLNCIAEHDWQFIGGCNCGCKDGNCSVPVNVCSRCGDCDYGQNEEANQIRAACHE